MNINVHIERLILEGLPVTRAQGRAVQKSVETELARLVSTHGLSSTLRAGGATPDVAAGTLQLTAGTHPKRLGQQIARAVYRGIGK